MRRYEWRAAQVALLEPHLPKNSSVGHPSADHRRIVNGLFWTLRAGAPWRDSPERDGPWQTIADRSVFWRRNGTWDRILRALQIERDAHGTVDGSQVNVDRTVIRGSRAAAGARRDGL